MSGIILCDVAPMKCILWNDSLEQPGSGLSLSHQYKYASFNSTKQISIYIHNANFIAYAMFRRIAASQHCRVPSASQHVATSTYWKAWKLYGGHFRMTDYIRATCNIGLEWSHDVIGQRMTVYPDKQITRVQQPHIYTVHYVIGLRQRRCHCNDPVVRKQNIMPC